MIRDTLKSAKTIYIGYTLLEKNCKSNLVLTINFNYKQYKIRTPPKPKLNKSPHPQINLLVFLLL